MLLKGPLGDTLNIRPCTGCGRPADYDCQYGVLCHDCFLDTQDWNFCEYCDNEGIQPIHPTPNHNRG